MDGKRKNGYAYGRGEKYSLELGGDINRAIASEFARLAAPETLPLFLRKLQRKALKQYQRREPICKGSGDIICMLDESSSAESQAPWCKAVALALLVWQGAAMAVGLDLLLPSPWQVACRLWSVWREPGFFATVAFSLLRISGGFALGLVLGVLLAVAAGRLRVLELLLWPYVTAIKSVPVASFIIICLIWMSTRQLAVFISFLMVFPVIYSNTLQGIKSADGALLEMARVYRLYD